MTLPIIVVSRLPRISALMKSPTAGMKVEQRAGEDARHRERQRDAQERLRGGWRRDRSPPRSSCGSIFSIATYSGRTMNGRKL